MMPAINEMMLAVSSSLAASMVVKATLLVTLGLIGSAIAGRSRASVRHCLLAATFGVLLLLPVAAILAPPVRSWQCMPRSRSRPRQLLGEPPSRVRP